MRTIKDIRVYQSTVPNTNGHSLPAEIWNRQLDIMARRMALKLREQGFSLGDFDHLYINFTTCSVPGGVAPAGRSPDPYHPWYRYYDVEISEALHACLCELSELDEPIAASLLERVLTEHFATDDFDEVRIRACLHTALSEGEDMLILYKEKRTATRTATVYLRLLNSGRFWPLLRVMDVEGHCLIEADLPQTIDLSSIGDVQVSAKRAVIKPKKNAFSARLEPLCFEWA